uniref:Uncharacterized protein n=1 Tax=Otus sunia TaxID=257818 RepID=A0A8C8E598_9STRI
MAVAETQLYAKVSNKHRSKSSSVLLESLLTKGFPAHIGSLGEDFPTSEGQVWTL